MGSGVDHVSYRNGCIHEHQTAADSLSRRRVWQVAKAVIYGSCSVVWALVVVTFVSSGCEPPIPVIVSHRAGSCEPLTMLVHCDTHGMASCSLMR